MNSSNGWTPERRAQQAARIREQKPWLQSTGPKSAAGKATVSRNAFKGGSWREMRDMARHLNKCLQDQQRGLKQF
ncbi:hypothetical protein ASE39_24860 [Acidovorax sp. Root267]|uniref:hypothetical protein n=1 Tax=Acidovorax sp. Root267 TaxID=1736505 RepID=UPI00070C039A|nr:hypothetical protein [Acidovorax sp. Root267]KRD23079.1 hypothetical protein ASE39_24860 [Acidovorax sp. Root267]